MTTTINFQKENVENYESLACAFDSIGALAETIEMILDDVDLDNIVNTQYKLTAIYKICYLLSDYVQNLSSRAVKLQEIKVAVNAGNPVNT